MSLRKKLNIGCIGLCALLIIVLFLPVVELYGVKATYWGESDHTQGIMFLLEFLGAGAIFGLYHVGKFKDNKYALLLLGPFLSESLRGVISVIKGDGAGTTIWFWLGFLASVASVALTIVSNYVSDKEPPKVALNLYNNGNSIGNNNIGNNNIGNNNMGYGQAAPYNNFNQPQQQPQQQPQPQQPMYGPPGGQPMNNNQPPMGVYNNFR